jgi:hypothetical protein
MEFAVKALGVIIILRVLGTRTPLDGKARLGRVVEVKWGKRVHSRKIHKLRIL